MALDLEAKKVLVQKIALHLNVEIWWTDHAGLMARLLDECYPANAPRAEETDVEIREAIRKKFVEKASKLWKEMNTDTVAVGMTRDGKRLVIAANIKKRTAAGVWSTKKDIRRGVNTDPYPDKFGFFDRRHEAAIQRLCDEFPETESVKITVLEPETYPKDKFENARRHAEMQILRFAAQAGLDIQVVGISKLACQKCAEKLDNAVRPIPHVHSDDQGQFEDPSLLVDPPKYKTVKNWEGPDEPGFGDIKTQTRIEFRQWRRGAKGPAYVLYQVGTSKNDPYYS